MLSLTVAGAAVALWWWSWPGFVGFLAGALVSYLNFRWLTRVALALGTVDDGGKPLKPVSALLLALRYLVFAAIGYGIFIYSGTAFRALLAGVFIHIAAVLVEAIYELIYAGTS